MTRKEQRHMGQQQLPDLTIYDETPEERDARHRGMPPLAHVKIETQRLGLPDGDAEAIYDSWLMSGFRSARGLKIASWKAAVRIWHRNKFFPSQKNHEPKPGELMTYEILDDIASWTAFKKLDVHRLGTEFKEWCEKNDRPKLVASFIKLLNAKL
jgi:hypothetical protein